MEPFVCKTRIYAGRGSLSVLREAGIRKPFLVADPYFAENGTARKVLQLTGATQSYLFSDRILALQDGRILKDGTPAEVLTQETMKQLYHTDVHVLSLYDDRARICIPAHLSNESGGL